MADTIRAIVRIRPLLQFEDEPAWMSQQRSVHCLNTKNIRNKIGKHTNSHQKQVQDKIEDYSFNFDAVLNEYITSQGIYKAQCKEIVSQSLRQSIHSSIITYGQTGSGKTYTTLGVSQAPGIIPCTLRDLFIISQSQKYQQYSFSLSYIQIYNEHLYDLFENNKLSSKTIKIQENSNWGVEVVGLRKQKVCSLEDCLKWLQLGQSNRAYGKKENHDRSSRSHTILRIFIEKWNKNYVTSYSTISIVDLAGSERLDIKKKNSQKQISESTSINKSLFQLSNVIQRLSEDKKQHIPFRDSKLTRILQSSLIGNSITVSRTLMIFCISPALLNFNQSLSTLRLAVKAKKIQLEPLTNNPQEYFIVEQLKKKLQRKNQQIKQMNHQIQRLNNQIKTIKAKPNLSTYKKQCNIQLMVLMDHQNFLIHQSDKGSDSEIDPNKYQNDAIVSQIKVDFMAKLHTLYGQYTDKLIRQILETGNPGLSEIELKIEQICFMNMVYEHEKMIEYKLPLISSMLTNFELEEKQFPQFYNILNNYYNNMLEKAQEKGILLSDLNTIKERHISQPSSFSNQHYSLNRHIQRKTDQTSSINDSEVFGSQIELQSIGNNLYSWGCRKDSRVFKGITEDSNLTRLDTLGHLSSIASGAHHTLLITNNGDLYGWGKNGEMQINNSNDSAVQIPKLISMKEKVVQVAAGWGHSLALSRTGNVYSWGYGKDGQLGIGKTESSSTICSIFHEFSVVKILAGHSHSGFIDCNQDYYSFGYNQDYRLMLKNKGLINQPTRVSIRGVVEAGLGVNHTCLVTKEGNIYAGGDGTDGQLGVQLDNSYPNYQEYQSNERRFDQEKLQKICPLVKLKQFSSNKPAIKVACGQYMTAVLTKNKEVYTFGKTSYNRLGHQQKIPSLILSDIDDIAVGCRFGFGWDQNGKVYGWGFNMYRQLCSESDQNIKKPEIIQLLSDKRISQICCGHFHSAAIGE